MFIIILHAFSSLEMINLSNHSDLQLETYALLFQMKGRLSNQLFSITSWNINGLEHKSNGLNVINWMILKLLIV